MGNLFSFFMAILYMGFASSSWAINDDLALPLRLDCEPRTSGKVGIDRLELKFTEHKRGIAYEGYAQFNSRATPTHSPYVEKLKGIAQGRITDISLKLNLGKGVGYLHLYPIHYEKDYLYMGTVEIRRIEDERQGCKLEWLKR